MGAIAHISTTSVAGIGRSLSGLLVASAVSVGCVGASTESSQQSAVIHGTDDRRDYYQVQDPRWRSLIERSAVALVRLGRLDVSDPSMIRLLGPLLGDRYQLCPGQRFIDDPTVAHCSGTLIADDLVLTAGHCVRGHDPCADLRLVFGYYRDNADTMPEVTSADVFRCTEVVVAFDGLSTAGELDHAIVRLERPATPRFEPVAIRSRTQPLEPTEALTAIGFGSGMPAKLAAGAGVRDPRQSTFDFFVADTDTFTHGSGGGVFGAAADGLVGITVRGPADYVLTASGCHMVNVCPTTGCGGTFPFEEVSYADRAIEHLCLELPEHALCPG